MLASQPGKKLDRYIADCENLLKKREGKFGPFLGCSAFPNCRYTRDL